MTDETATQILARENSWVRSPDFRLHRAKAMTAAIMREIEDVVPDVDQRAVYERLLDVFHRNGAAWTTDEERERMGLEPRDQHGWTPSERVEAERQKREAMLMVQSQMFMAYKPDGTI